MTTINPNAEMPMVQGTQAATITDKKSSAVAAGLSKVGSAALTALKAVGIVFAIVATAGLILANKDFRQMASNFFFGPKVEVEYTVNDSHPHSEIINSMIQAKKEAKAENKLPKISAKELVKAQRKLQHVEQEKIEFPELTTNETRLEKFYQVTDSATEKVADHVKANGKAYGMAAAGAALTVAAALASGVLFAASEVAAAEVIESTAISLI